jgi:hypothetical protein
MPGEPPAPRDEVPIFSQVDRRLQTTPQIKLAPFATNLNKDIMAGVLASEKKANRAVPTHHCTPDALRWRSRLALDVGEGQKLTN